MPVSRLIFTFYLEMLTRCVVIGDRERCIQAGMDDHITSTLLDLASLGNS